MSLEPIGPEEAVEWYLEHREDDWRYESRRTIANSLDVFLTWTAESGLTDMNELGGRDLMRFKSWRKAQENVKTISLNGNLASLRRFLKFCVRIDAVGEGLPDDVPMSNVSEEQEVRDDAPPDEEVRVIRTYLRKYRRASREHVVFELIAEVGIRTGAVRAIDVDDFRPDEKVINLRHRPESKDEYGTPLKNGADGERNINISSGLRDLIADYKNNPDRPDGTDKYGRRPLFTSESSDGTVSRISVNRPRDDFYKLTRPCVYSDECPAGRDESDCGAARNRYAYRCPENFTPHPLRSWSIMDQLDRDVDRATLSNRVDVSVPVLKKHYDHRTKERKRTNRLDELEGKLPGYGSGGKQSGEDFHGTMVLGDPAFFPVLVGTKTAVWLNDRVHRELRALSPGSAESALPDPSKAARGAIAYAMFVCLVALNFVMIGGKVSPLV